MKTPHALGKPCFATVVALVCLGIVAPVAAQQPKNIGPPTVENNSDGGTTTTQRVDFGKRPDQGGMTQIEGDVPFYGQGDQRVSRDKDGNITKVEWVKKGRICRAWFFTREAQNVVVAGYDYDRDGKPTSKSEQSFDRITGRKLSKDDEKLKPNGEVGQGKRMRLEEGKWVVYEWDPQSETWVNKGPVEQGPNETLKDFLKKNGIEEEPPPGHASAGGPVFYTDEQWRALTPAQRTAAEHRAQETIGEAMARASSRWNLQFGTVVQSTNVSFSFSNRAENFGLFTEGSTQVYDSGDTFVQYEDGSVSKLDDFAQTNGFATFSGGEVTATGTAQIGAATVNTIDATFHSTVIDENGGDSVKDKTFIKVAPSIEIDYTFKQCEKGKVSLFSQYAFYNINQSSGTVNGDIRGQLHTFTYAGVDQPAGPDRIFFDPTVINGPPFNATPPFMSPVHMISDLRTRSHADLDLQQHQFTFGGRAWLPGKWSGLNIVAGPTLTVSCFDYNARTDLWMGNTKWTSSDVSDSGQSAQFGFMAQAGARLDLWRNVSLDVYARYDFVDQLKIGNSSAKAEIGNNSYGGGVSINWNF